MIRVFAAAAALATLATGGAASAQTWGQPVYLNAYGRPVGSGPLSEVETRSYVQTGRWADGYSDRPQVYVPAPGYAAPYTFAGQRNRYRHGDYERRYSHVRSGYGYGYGHDRPNDRHDRPSQPGYRDEWGYNDDRPPSVRGGSGHWRSRGHERDCGCGDVYLYDR